MTMLGESTLYVYVFSDRLPWAMVVPGGVAKSGMAHTFAEVRLLQSVSGALRVVVDGDCRRAEGEAACREHGPSWALAARAEIDAALGEAPDAERG